MRKILVLLLVLFSVATFGQGEVLKQGQKVLKRSGKILKSHYPWEYNEPSDWINIHFCPKDEILLVASDQGGRYIAYFVICASNNSYVVDIYGGTKGDSLIYNHTYTYGTVFEYQLPLNKGKTCSLGYTTYKIRIYPLNRNNKITYFAARKHPLSSFTNESILLVNANCNTVNTFKINGNIPGVSTTRLKYANIYNCTAITDASYCCTNSIMIEYFTFAKTADNIVNMEGTFNGCSILKKINLPNNLNSVTNIKALYQNCYLLEQVTGAINMNSLSLFGGNGSSPYKNNYKLKQLQYPLIMNGVINVNYGNQNCTTATHYRLPEYANNIISISYWFDNNYQITYLKFPRILNKVTASLYVCANDTNLQTLIMPDSMILATDLDGFGLALWNLDTISPCVWGTSSVSRVYFTIRDLKTFKQPTLRVNKLVLRGGTLATKSNLHTIDIDWANSTYGGSSPQIDIRWNSLSATTLDAIFTALPTVVGKTINVAGNPGSATCTPSIATAKGWTVTIL